jgi:hypothetical protein
MSTPHRTTDLKQTTDTAKKPRPTRPAVVQDIESWIQNADPEVLQSALELPDRANGLAAILTIQRTYGNRVAQRMIAQTSHHYTRSGKDRAPGRPQVSRRTTGGSYDEEEISPLSKSPEPSS